MSKNKSQKKIWLFVVIGVVVLAAAGLVTWLVLRDGGTDTSENRDGTSWESFTSETFGFTVDLPGSPNTENSSVEAAGETIAMTQYTLETKGGKGAYMVQVGEYPAAFDLSTNERGVLDGGINGAAQNSGATIVESTNDGTFLGFTAARAEMSMPTDAGDQTSYQLHFIKGNDLFTLMTVGISRADFDRMVDSFKF